MGKPRVRVRRIYDEPQRRDAENQCSLAEVLT